MPEYPPLDVGGSLATLARAVTKVRDRCRAQASQHGLEWSAYAVLRPVVDTGPQRVTALAESVQLTPSTVSRLVTHLINEGLLERRADAEDGRACIVAPTAQGLRAYHELRAVWDGYVERLLSDWSAQDRADLARLVGRLAAAVEADTAPRTSTARLSPAHCPDSPSSCDLTSMGMP